MSPVAYTLPSPPGPLLWIAPDYLNPPALGAEYTVVRLRVDEVLTWTARADYPWVFLSDRSLSGSPLPILSRLNDLAAIGATLIVDLLTEVGGGNDGGLVISLTSLTALLSTMGWGLTESIGSDSRIQAYRRLSRIPRYLPAIPTRMDWQDCWALFEKAFGEPADPGLWSWKYGGDRAVSVIVRRQGQLIAHYGGISRPILFFGQSARAVQIADVAVDPLERGVMTKTGAFCKAASTYQETIFGLDDRHICGFGFPNRRHLLLGERAGFYAEVDSMLELRWSPKADMPSFTNTAQVIKVADHVQTIRELWQGMAKDLSESIVGTRDPDYLRYRYDEHPRFGYHIFLVRRRWGTPLGLVVLRREADLCRMVDTVGPIQYLPLLVDYARRIAARWGSAKLLVWITAAQAHRFGEGAAEIEPLDIKIPGNSYVERVPVEELKNRWWLMMGDTDFM